ncbi:MAG: hypothetical protein HRU20_15115 [Pseudomonadales bacterium]|nr:hypothetical protein [Pseudomonadales bacterium]
MNIKKGITVFIVIALGLMLSGFAAFSLLVSNGFRDYTAFCQRYVVQLDQHKHETGIFPESLKTLENPEGYFFYSSSDCRYIASAHEFSFYPTTGFIEMALFTSNQRQWLRD